MDSHFELRHLRYFTAVAEEKNFSRAAVRLFITQPALSRQIKDLEKRLDVELFIRTPAGLILSPAGVEFLPQARRILEVSAEAALSMRRFTDCRNQSLSLGYSAPVPGDLLGTALQTFRQRHAQIEVRLFELSPARQIEALCEGRLDVALVGHAAPELAEEFDLSVLCRIPLDAVLPASHRLAKRASIKLHDLQDADFVGLDENQYPGRNAVIRDLCRKAGFDPEITHQADGLSTMLALIGSGLGVGLIPDEVRQMPHNNAVFVPLKAPQAAINFCAAVKRGDKRAAVRTLLQEFRSAGSTG